MLNRLAIYDLDGTVIDSSHRYKTQEKNGKICIDLNHWRENQHKALDDKLLPLHAQYKVDIEDLQCYVIVATARELHNPDLEFIEKILGAPDYIISRPHGSNVSGALLKIQSLKKFFNLKSFKVAIQNATFYEDNATYLKEVCDCFKIKGVYIPSSQGH